MPSIKDVAKLAGVSATTVSAVINDLDCVKETTRKKVLLAIEELGYIPNRSARELVTRKKQNIGFIAMVSENFEQRRGTFDIGSDMFYVDYFQEIAKEFADSDYGLLYENFYFDKSAPSLPKMISQQRVDSVFVLGGLHTEDFLKKIKNTIPNIVALGCQTELAVCVHNDYYQSVYHCIQYLINRGHRRIAMVNGDVTSVYQLKQQAYKDALTNANIPFDKQLVFDAKFTASAGYAVAQSIMTLPKEKMPTAVFFACDIIAAGAYRYFQECGVRIPEDISVIGHENLVFSDFITPTLTTVDFNKAGIAAKAAAIMKKMQRDDDDVQSAIVPYRLVERNSVRYI